MTGKILLVDDEPDILKTVQKLLWVNGYETDIATDGKEALEKIFGNPPLLIVLDIMMPNVNGYQVCRAVRENPDTQSIPIIMLTAKAQNFDKFWGEEVGATIYLTKPFDNKELINIISEQLGKTN
ncbi:MAG: response regulator [Fibrobacteria bacterium]|nr:response regulator [Fibrobacteria bacterium]